MGRIVVADVRRAGGVQGQGGGGWIDVVAAGGCVDRLALPHRPIEPGVSELVAHVDHVGLASGVQGQAAIAELKD